MRSKSSSRFQWEPFLIWSKSDSCCEDKPGIAALFAQGATLPIARVAIGQSSHSPAFNARLFRPNIFGQASAVDIFSGIPEAQCRRSNRYSMSVKVTELAQCSSTPKSWESRNIIGPPLVKKKSVHACYPWTLCFYGLLKLVRRSLRRLKPIRDPFLGSWPVNSPKPFWNTKIGNPLDRNVKGENAAGSKNMASSCQLQATSICGIALTGMKSFQRQRNDRCALLQKRKFAAGTLLLGMSTPTGWLSEMSRPRISAKRLSAVISAMHSLPTDLARLCISEVIAALLGSAAWFPPQSYHFLGECQPKTSLHSLPNAPLQTRPSRVWPKGSRRAKENHSWYHSSDHESTIIQLLPSRLRKYIWNECRNHTGCGWSTLSRFDWIFLHRHPPPNLKQVHQQAPSECVAKQLGLGEVATGTSHIIFPYANSQWIVPTYQILPNATITQVIPHEHLCLSVYLSICVSVYLSICLSVYLSVSLSVYLI